MLSHCSLNQQKLSNHKFFKIKFIKLLTMLYVSILITIQNVNFTLHSTVTPNKTMKNNGPALFVHLISSHNNTQNVTNAT